MTPPGSDDDEATLPPPPSLDDGETSGRWGSWGVVAGAYIIAAGVAGVVAGLIGSVHPLLTVLVADLAAMVVVFAFSRALDNSSVYDPYWSVVPPVIALYFYWVHQPGTEVTRQILVLGLVWAWGIRLTVHRARAWPGLDHEHWRHVVLRHNDKPYWWQSFFGLHLFPTLLGYLGCLTLYPAISVGTKSLGPIDLLATVVTVGAIIIEFVADEQLRSFNAEKLAGEICTVGLWRWSRHPNYFGELAFWWGLWLFAVASGPVWWWTIVGPLAITAMFVFVSVPMMDERSAERRPGFAQHAERTSMLLPLRPKD